jgi:hypothetical protein
MAARFVAKGYIDNYAQEVVVGRLSYEMVTA